MKQYLLFITIVISSFAHAQDFDNCIKINNYTAEPDNYNKFISNSSISWASYFRPWGSHSFLNCPIEGYPSIYDYLRHQQKTGKIKSYDNDGSYKVVADSLSDLTNPSWQLDSSKHIDFQQILYIDNHKLRSYIIGAGVAYRLYTTSGIFVGDVPKTYCCLNENPYIDKRNDKIVSLPSSYTIYSTDSAMIYGELDNIKASYGMNLITSLWYDLSKGYNEVIDLNTNKKIEPDIVWGYPIADSFKQYQYDSLGNPTSTYTMMSSAPALTYLTRIGIYQDWYYDVTKNIFFNTIKQADIYTTAYDEDTHKQETKKRFKIIFK